MSDDEAISSDKKKVTAVVMRDRKHIFIPITFMQHKFIFIHASAEIQWHKAWQNDTIACEAQMTIDATHNRIPINY